MCKDSCPCPPIDMSKWNKKAQEYFTNGEYRFDGEINTYEECLNKLKVDKVED